MVPCKCPSPWCWQTNPHSLSLREPCFSERTSHLAWTFVVTGTALKLPKTPLVHSHDAAHPAKADQQLLEKVDNSASHSADWGRLDIVWFTCNWHHNRPCDTSNYIENSSYSVWNCQMPTEKLAKQVVEKTDSSSSYSANSKRLHIVSFTCTCHQTRHFDTSNYIENSAHSVWNCQRPTEKVVNKLGEKRR